MDNDMETDFSGLLCKDQTLACLLETGNIYVCVFLTQSIGSVQLTPISVYIEDI